MKPDESLADRDDGGREPFALTALIEANLIESISGKRTCQRHVCQVFALRTVPFISIVRKSVWLAPLRTSGRASEHTVDICIRRKTQRAFIERGVRSSSMVATISSSV